MNFPQSTQNVSRLLQFARSVLTGNKGVPSVDEVEKFVRVVEGRPAFVSLYEMQRTGFVRTLVATESRENGQQAIQSERNLQTKIEVLDEFAHCPLCLRNACHNNKSALNGIMHFSAMRDVFRGQKHTVKRKPMLKRQCGTGTTIVRQRKDCHRKSQEWRAQGSSTAITAFQTAGDMFDDYYSKEQPSRGRNKATSVVRDLIARRSV